MPITAIFQVRIDARILANIGKTFDLVQTPYRNRSELIRLALEDYTHILLTNYPEIKPVESTGEAERYLKGKGIDTRLPGVNRRIVIKQKIKEDKDLQKSKEVLSRADKIIEDQKLED